MKKGFLSAAIILSSLGLFAQSKVNDIAKFESETIDFGKIKQGVPTTGTFTFTNISKQPIIIEQANPTCGCTMSDYTKAPVENNKTGFIKATYNAAAAGHFEKHLSVKFAGVDEIKSITLTGDVLTAEEFDKLPKVTATPVQDKQAVVPVKKPSKKSKAKRK
jgi:hypothetical protein